MNKNDFINADKTDTLAYKRDEFLIPENMIYLDGNSLGVLPVRARTRIAQVVDKEWGNDLIASWNKHHWIDLPRRTGEKIARLIGAAPDQTICCDSISVNLFKLLAAALSVQQKRGQHHRRTILSLSDNFPTDLYVAQGLQQLLGEHKCELELASAEQLMDAVNEDVAVLMLTHVNFRTGEILDMQAITEYAHKQGVLVIWDLAHSAGALPVELDLCEVDFAVGCGYKYLNGGPGAPAFLYAAKRHLPELQQPISGWMGHAAPFAFDSHYCAAPGIDKFLSGTPNILSMSALDSALDVFADVDMHALREKSLNLTESFARLVTETAELNQLQPVFPQEKTKRGSQVAYRHPHAYALCQALIEQNIIGDFRAPDVLRLGFTPLYTRYIDVWECIEGIKRIISQKRYLQDKYQAKSKVT